MDDKNKQDLKAIASVTGGSLGNLALAFALCMAASFILRLAGVPEAIRSALSMGFLLAIIFADPIEVWRGERTWRKFGFYAAFGFGLSFFITFAMDAAVPATPEGDTLAVASETTAAPLAAAEETKGFPWFWLVILLTGPIVFALPLLEKLFNVEGKEEKPSREDLMIDAQFPIFMALTSSLNLLIPGALWLIGASVPVAAAVYLTGILLVVMDVAYNPEEDSARDLQEEWGPRPETAVESWANLRKGLGQCLASALFIGSTIYLGLQAITFEKIDFDNAGALDVLAPLLMSGGIMLAITLALFALGALITALAAYGIGKLRFGNDPLSIVELGQRSVGRLFTGGMAWVRPSLETD